MSQQRLPPLNALVAFEAAARLRSFTRAADELNVTQGAVSRQVKLLEADLGHALLRRSRPALQLTPLGESYYSVVHGVLKRLASTSDDIRKNDDSRRITIVTTSAMASFWLMPRFSRFRSQHPDVDVRIIAVESLATLSQTEYDLGLFYCRTPPGGLRNTPLFKERVFPVCSPDFLASNPGILVPGQLVSATLLVLDSEEDWVNWDEWFEACGLESSCAGAQRINLNNYPILIQAALNGQGVALAWETLVDQYLESGLLVRATDLALTTESQFYLLEPRRDEQHSARTATTAFRQWLLSEVRN